MAQLHLHRPTQRCAPETSQITPTPPVEQLLRGGGQEGSRWSPTSSSLLKESEHEQEDYDHTHHHKKSVLTKVKEKAIKLKHSLGNNKKKHEEGEEGRGVHLDDDEEEEEEEGAEFLGAPMYESEMAPERYKETLRQHPRADPVISETHHLPNSVKQGSDHGDGAVNEMPTSLKKLSMAETKSHPPFQSSTKLPSPRKTLAEIMAENPFNPNKKLTRSMTEKPISPKPTISFSTPPASSSRETPFSTRIHGGGSDQIWDKGVSVKEYLMHKFEPGEDEKALSQVISEAMSPRKSATDRGVVEKMKEAVSSLIWTNESTTTNVHTGEEPKSVRTFRPK